MGAILKMLKLTGFKTYIAAIGMIAQGIYLVTEGQVMEGWALVNAGLAAFGFRAALDK